MSEASTTSRARYIRDEMWSDDWFYDLGTVEKLVWLFLLTNERNNVAGVYKLNRKWGIYVELEETKVEGMIRLKDLSGDYYYFDDKNIRAVGHNTGAQVNLGDKLKIKVRNVDMERRRLDFELMEILEAGN